MQLAVWITLRAHPAEESAGPRLHTVSPAHAVESDYAAPVNGLKLPWSTGPVEGTQTKVKLRYPAS